MLNELSEAINVVFYYHSHLFHILDLRHLDQPLSFQADQKVRGREYKTTQGKMEGGQNIRMCLMEIKFIVCVVYINGIVNKIIQL